jgi:hypothetical protein
VASNCDISKEGANNLSVIEQAVQDAIITDADVLGMGKFVEEVEDYLRNASENAVTTLLGHYLLLILM